MWTDLLYRLRALFRRRAVEDELDDEMRLHLELQTEKYIRSGVAADEAMQRARLEFGGADQIKEECRDARGTRSIENMFQDLRYALKGLRRSPAFAAVVVASLALGIGANTTVFGIVNGMVLQPLPIESPEQFYSVDRNGEPSHSFLNYKDIRDRNSVFSSLFMYRIAPMSLEHTDGAKRVWGLLVTGNYFETLGIRPSIGRFFGPADDLYPNGSPYAVLSFDTWRGRFGGDPDIIGRTVRVNAREYTVLGVAPEGFHGTDVFYRSQIWLPLSMQSHVEGYSWLERRQTQNGWVAGRLRPGITAKQADENLKVIADALAREYVLNEGMRLTVTVPGLAGSTLRAPVSGFSGGVMLLAGLVLIAACVNIASLLSARLTDRNREFAVRLAIGAGPGRIIRQLLTESMVVSTIGGVVGITVSVLLLRLLSRWKAPLEMPIQVDVGPDLRVLAFGSAVVLVTGLLFGTLGALRVSRWNPNDGLKGAPLSERARRWAPGDVLLVVQVSACCLLITASFVALRGLQESLETPLGFQPAGVAVVGYDLSQAGYSEKDGRIFHERALNAIAQIPGVEDYALAKSVPLSTDQSRTLVYPGDTTDFRPLNAVRATYYRVSPGFFRTMRTKLIEGREFSAQDRFASPPVAIVNETLARRVLGGAPWVGKRYRMGPNSEVEVVGVVEDGKYSHLSESPTPVLFEPMMRRYEGEATLIARSSRPESDVASDMRRAVAALDRSLPVYAVGSLDQLLSFVMLPIRAAVIALSVFGILAIMLVVTGVHGLCAYTVARRTREIGIRVAIGARATDVLWLMFGRTAALVGFGSVAGFFLAVFASQILSRIVFGVSPLDPRVSAGVILTMILIGILGVWGPLRRSLKVDPVQALRQE